MKRPFFLLLLLLAGGSGELFASTGVTVDVVPARVVRRTFDPERPPAEMPKLTPPEVGQCVYEFSCEMETRVEQFTRGRQRSSARVISVAFTTRLNITLWTPVNASRAVIEHEEGHREISEHYYRPAAAIARRLGAELVGASVAAPPGKAALETELDRLQNDLIRRYLAETLARCSDAQTRFDAITRHSLAAVPVPTAIAQALAEENAAFLNRATNSAARPAADAPRRHPTRPAARDPRR